MSAPLLSKLLLSNSRRTVWENITILTAWSVLVLYHASIHVMWRDEVRALSLALSGDSVMEMLAILRGDGHPALWYLLLRGAHNIFNSVLVLPATAFLIAAGAVALLIFSSPFPRAVLIALVGSQCFIFEYSVMSRNYGIAALLFFLIATFYRSWRDRGPALGVLLLVLANTNVVAAMMAGAFLLFWFLELLEVTPLRWSGEWKSFLLNASLGAAGLILCGLTILPANDHAAAINWSEISPAIATAQALINPGGATPGTLLMGAFPGPISSLILFGLTLVLLPNRAAFISALAGLLLLSLFSNLFAAGTYRHALVWFVFYIALVWISWKDISHALKAQDCTRKKIIHHIGIITFLFYLEFQFLIGLIFFEKYTSGNYLESRTVELAKLLTSSRILKEAIIVAEPDFIVEALPFYVNNPIYFVREGQFGKFVRFTKSGNRKTDLGEILKTSRNLQNSTKLPVAIVIAHKIIDIKPGILYKESYNWFFSASEEQITEFQSATNLIAEFGPSLSDETYNVYMLKP